MGDPNGHKRFLTNSKYDEEKRTFTGTIDFPNDGKFVDFKLVFS
jgi:hypothetical protein